MLNLHHLLIKIFNKNYLYLIIILSILDFESCSLAILSYTNNFDI